MIAKRDTRPCDTCGKPVTKLLSQVKPTTIGWFCSASCKSKKYVTSNLHGRWATAPAVRETRPCDACGKSVTKRMSQVKPGAAWTCSVRCAALVRRVPPRQPIVSDMRPKVDRKNNPIALRGPGMRLRGDTFACLSCGKDFYREPRLILQGQTFCSRPCANEASRRNQVFKSCPSCGKEMRLSASKSTQQFCSKQCEAIADIKRPMERTHNGKPAKQDIHGYVMVWEPTHPNKTFHGWQYEHRLVAEKTVGRLLTSQEHTHHLNGIKNDNRPENLQVMDSKEHVRLSSQEYRADINRQLAELAEYKKRFGPLT